MSPETEQPDLALEEPPWLQTLHPQAVGSHCWNWVRRDPETHGQFLSVASYVPAIGITTLGVAIASLLYAIGYALTRPDAGMGAE